MVEQLLFEKLDEIVADFAEPSNNDLVARWGTQSVAKRMLY